MSSNGKTHTFEVKESNLRFENWYIENIKKVARERKQNTYMRSPRK